MAKSSEKRTILDPAVRPPHLEAIRAAVQTVAKEDSARQVSSTEAETWRGKIDSERDKEYTQAMSEKREILLPLRRGSRSPEEFEAAVRKVSQFHISRGREDFRKTDPLTTGSPQSDTGSADDKDLTKA